MVDAHEFNAVIQKRKSAVVAFWGEAGVGKTHEAKKLLNNLPCPTLTLHAATSLSMITSSLPKPKKQKAWAARTLERLERGETPEAVDAIAATLEGLAPFVLQFEDVHEASDERRTFIHALAKTVLSSKGVGLLVTSRMPLDEPFVLYELKPLSAETSWQLLGDELGAPVPEAASRWIYQRAAGNPLYTLEYLRFLARQGCLWSDGARWHWRKPQDDAMPITVEALIEVQLAKVHAHALPALQLKALLSVETEDEHWARALTISTQSLDLIKAHLNEQGILQDGRFVHPLYREVILKTLPRLKREQLAKKLLEVFVDDPAYILRFLDDAHLEKAQALNILKHAAAQTKMEGNDQLKGLLLAKAAENAVGEERGALALAAAKVLQTCDPNEAGIMTELALGLDATAVEALEILISVKARSRDFELAPWLERIPPSAREKVDLAKLELTVQFLNENHPAVVGLWEENPHLGERSAPAVAASLSSIGRQAEAKTLLRGQTSADLPPTEWCELMRINALLEYREGHYQAAEEIYEKLLPVAQDATPIRTQTSLQLNRALVLRNLGRLPEAADAMGEALILRQELGEAISYAFVQASLGELLTELGDYERAETLLHEALATFRTYGRVRFLIMTEHNTGLLHAAKASPLSKTLATVHTATALHLAREAGETLLLTELLIEAALVRCQFGQLEEAFALVSEGLELLPQAGNPAKYRARALLALGLALEKTAPERTSVLISEAFELAAGFDFPAEMHKIGLERDRLNHDSESARERLRWFEAQGLHHGATLARRYFPALAEEPADSPLMGNVSCLELLGPMRFRTQERSLPLRGAKRQELLALLAEAKLSGRTEVPALELTDALYPGENERSALQNLKTLVHDLRGALGKGTIYTTASGYALGQVTTDVEQYLQTSATGLWRGPYLEGVSAPEQETVREPLYLNLSATAAGLLETAPKEAYRLSRLLLTYDPYNLEFLGLALRSLHATGNPKSLTKLYDEAKARFAEVGESLPPQWQTFLTR